jgi:ubiquinone/menaquinone biosynthesis C-methylase UbiE
MDNLDDNIVSKYWDGGWKKRNVEIEDLVNSSLDDLRKKAQERLDLHMKQKGMGSLFSNEINFEKFNNKKLLNIGCGTGLEANIFLCNSSVDITAIDITNEAIKNTKKILNTHKRGEAIRANAERMPFEDNSFDIVYSSGVIHHAESTENCVDEIYRVLKPGGVAYIGLYSTTGINFIYLRIKARIMSLMSRNSYKDIFSNLTDTDWNIGSAKTPISRTFTKRELLDLFKDFRISSIRRGNFSSELFRTTLLSKNIYFIGIIPFKIIQMFENFKFLSFFGASIYSVLYKK